MEGYGNKRFNEGCSLTKNLQACAHKTTLYCFENRFIIEDDKAHPR